MFKLTFRWRLDSLSLRCEMKKLIIGVLFTLAFSINANAHLTPDEQSAKSRGILLFNQYKNAQLELRITAKAGDAEAQFYLAEELRKEKQLMTAEAQQWYEASAAQGDYYSMFQLATAGDLCAVADKCPSGIKSAADWLDLLIKTAEPRAMKGDGEAMAIMYNAKSDLTWLEKSAEAGYAPAQWLLANRYSEGEGSFLLPWNRKSAEEKWLKASSEGGNPKAMIEYISILYERGDMEGVRHWLEIAAKTGYQDAVSSYGAYLSHTPDKVGL